MKANGSIDVIIEPMEERLSLAEIYSRLKYFLDECCLCILLSAATVEQVKHVVITTHLHCIKVK